MLFLQSLHMQFSSLGSRPQLLNIFLQSSCLLSQHLLDVSLCGQCLEQLSHVCVCQGDRTERAVWIPGRLRRAHLQEYWDKDGRKQVIHYSCDQCWSLTCCWTGSVHGSLVLLCLPSGCRLWNNRQCLLRPVLTGTG